MDLVGLLLIGVSVCDVVVLSPGCASFDWYDGFEARGDDFRRLVEHRLQPTGEPR